MSTIAVAEEVRGERIRYDLLGTLQVGWRAMRHHRQERRAIIAMSRLTPHAIRDMGFDPEYIYTALDGTWDEVDPVRLRTLLPRRETI